MKSTSTERTTERRSVTHTPCTAATYSMKSTGTVERTLTVSPTDTSCNYMIDSTAKLIYMVDSRDKLIYMIDSRAKLIYMIDSRAKLST